MSRFVVLITAILVIVLGWIALWFLAAGVAKNKASQFMQASAGTSLKVQCGRFDVAGFPFRFDVSCTNLQVRANDLTVSLPLVKATLLIYRPTRVLISAAGPARLNDAFSGSRQQVRWNNLRILARTNGWALARLSVEADNLELVDTLIGEKLVARVRHFEARLVDNEKKYNQSEGLAQLAAFMRADKVTLPEFDLANANFRLQANIDAIPDDLRKWSPATIARNWFNGKTGIDLMAFTGKDDRSEFKLSGRLSTTGQGRLSGDFALHTQNVEERLQPVFDQTTLQILFGFPNKDASHDQTYSLRHGVLLAGNLPVLTIGALN